MYTLKLRIRPWFNGKAFFNSVDRTKFRNRTRRMDPYLLAVLEVAGQAAKSRKRYFEVGVQLAGCLEQHQRHPSSYYRMDSGQPCPSMASWCSCPFPCPWAGRHQHPSWATWARNRPSLAGSQSHQLVLGWQQAVAGLHRPSSSD